MKKILRKILLHCPGSYWAFRYCHMQKLSRKIASSRKKLLVYQMGKVGSTSMLRTLEQALIGEVDVFHVHTLDPKHIAEVGETYQEMWPKSSPENIWNAEYLRNRISRYIASKQWSIVALTREPIARNISHFFQSFYIESVSGGGLQIKSPFFGFELFVQDNNPEQLIQLFFERYDHQRPLEYFDIEFKKYLNIDIYQSSFEQEQGWAIVEQEGIKLLLLKLEVLDSAIRPALLEFLGIDSFEIVKENVGEDKVYQQLYKNFIDFFSAPSSYLKNMYDSKYAKHFYTEQELEEFWRKWSG